MDKYRFTTGSFEMEYYRVHDVDKELATLKTELFNLNEEKLEYKETIQQLRAELAKYQTVNETVAERLRAAEAAIRAAMMHLRTNYDIDGNLMDGSDAYMELADYERLKEKE